MIDIREETLQEPERFARWPDIEPSLWETALASAAERLKSNLATFPPGLYPAPSSRGGLFPAIRNVEWTSSFWPGMLWLAYEATGEELFREEALARVPDFRKRLDEREGVDTHDLGFLYTLSCVAPWRLLGHRPGREAALKAATMLLSRYFEKAGVIQAWGDLSDPAQRGRIIIDCAMNLPLLFWASEETGNPYYREAAIAHLRAANSNLIRKDASSFHTYFFDVQTGRPLRGTTAQGRSDDSCWARGQAWGIYGLALGFRYLRDPELLEISSRLALYFLNRLPEDLVCYWDLSFSDGSGEERDSSAAAIAACGLLELASSLPLTDPRRRRYEIAALRIGASLVELYAAPVAAGGAAASDGEGSNGLLLHSVYNKPKGEGVDECCAWGDYFYLELLVRLTRAWKPYW
jgi:unsaturated chondroitin disaccharide hydrolase